MDLKQPLYCSYPGCTFSASGDQKALLDDHFIKCPQRLVRCLYLDKNNCNWTGKITDFFLHMHNVHCDIGPNCNRLYNQNEQIEWKTLPCQLGFDLTKLHRKEYELEYQDYFHFLKTEQGDLGLLMTTFHSIEPVESIPLGLFGIYHKLLWYSKTERCLVANKNVRLEITMNYQNRRSETTILDFDETDMKNNATDYLDCTVADESRWTYLPLADEPDCLLADVRQVPVVEKRKRVEDEHAHVSEKKTKKSKKK